MSFQAEAGQDLLVPIFQRGKLVYESPSLVDIQRTAQEELAKLPDSVKRFVNPQRYFVGLETKLHDLKIELRDHL